MVITWQYWFLERLDSFLDELATISYGHCMDAVGWRQIVADDIHLCEEDIHWLIECMAHLALTYTVHFERKVVNLVEAYPFKMLWMIYSEPSESCSERAKVSKDIMQTPDHKLDPCNVKLKKLFEADLEYASSTSLASNRLFNVLMTISAKLKIHTQRVEDMNNFIKSQGLRSPNISLELLGSRMTLKSAACEGITSQFQWSKHSKRMISLMDACMDNYQSGMDLMSEPLRWSCPEPISLPPKQQFEDALVDMYPHVADMKSQIQARSKANQLKNALLGFRVKHSLCNIDMAISLGKRADRVWVPVMLDQGLGIECKLTSDTKSLDDDSKVEYFQWHVCEGQASKSLVDFMDGVTVTSRGTSFYVMQVSAKLSSQDTLCIGDMHLKLNIDMDQAPKRLLTMKSHKKVRTHNPINSEPVVPEEIAAEPVTHPIDNDDEDGEADADIVEAADDADAAFDISKALEESMDSYDGVDDDSSLVNVEDRFAVQAAEDLEIRRAFAEDKKQAQHHCHDNETDVVQDVLNERLKSNMAVKAKLLEQEKRVFLNKWQDVLESWSAECPQGCLALVTLKLHNDGAVGENGSMSLVRHNGDINYINWVNPCTRLGRIVQLDLQGCAKWITSSQTPTITVADCDIIDKAVGTRCLQIKGPTPNQIKRNPSVANPRPEFSEEVQRIKVICDLSPPDQCVLCSGCTDLRHDVIDELMRCPICLMSLHPSCAISLGADVSVVRGRLSKQQACEGLHHFDEGAVDTLLQQMGLSVNKRNLCPWCKRVLF